MTNEPTKKLRTIYFVVGRDEEGELRCYHASLDSKEAQAEMTAARRYYGVTELDLLGATFLDQ